MFFLARTTATTISPGMMSELIPSTIHSKADGVIGADLDERDQGPMISNETGLPLYAAASMRKTTSEPSLNLPSHAARSSANTSGLNVGSTGLNADI